MSYSFIALLMFASMLIMLSTGRQIPFVIGGIASLFAVLLWGQGGLDMLFFSTYGITNWFTVVSIPMFVFMGLVLAKSGGAEKLFYAMEIFLGRIPGGLGIGTIGICSLVAAMSGGCEAATVTAGTIALPEMLKRGYNKKMVTGLVQAGGSLGFLIPPSIVFIFYGMIARVSIGHLWAAGLLPGLLLAGMYCLYVAIRCYLNPKMGPPFSGKNISLKEKLIALKAGIAPILLILAVLGLLMTGVATIIECSAIGALGALVLMILNKNFKKEVLFDILDETLKVTTMIMWILMASILFGAIFNGLGAINAVSQILSMVGQHNKWIVIIIIQLSFFILGTFLDDTALLIIVAPLYIPVVKSLGFDLVWFGVLYVVNMQMAFITPPFGYTLFVLKGVAPKEISLTDIYTSIVPYLFIQAFCLVILMIFPNIALWLPNILFPK